MPHVRPAEVVESALADSAAGMPDAANAAKHGVAVKTIRRWRRLYQRRGLPRGQAHTSVRCPRCDGAELDEPAYAELLGWYLGDGHIGLHHGGVYDLHIFNDKKFPDNNAHILDLMRRVKPGGRPNTREVPGCVISKVSWKHNICLFPQHGPGRKHDRPIVLERWQQEVVARHPFAFLRGLFHSDGCRSNNWTSKLVAGERKRYDYPRWQFSNNSDDIRGLLCWALDLVGVPWKQSNWKTISVNTRDAVARLDDTIGLKS